MFFIHRLQNIPPKTLLRFFLFSILAFLILLAGYFFLPGGVDWAHTYRPATLALLNGKSPYSVEIFYSAPWSVLPLIPFALLPEKLGRAGLFLLGMVSFAFTAHRLGAKPLSMALFLLSPPVIHCLLNSNIEWLPLLGFVLPPQIGLFFIAIKPQIGVAVGLYWLVEAWRKDGVREVMRVFLPFTLVLLASFLLFGFWPLRFQDTLVLTRGYNASLWPSGIPIGLVFLMLALRKRDVKFAMIASPFLSPYVLLHAWVGALAALVTQPLEILAAVLGLWILVWIRGWGSW